MSSEVRRWWSDDRIQWYERAAEHTDFHARLAAELSRIIPEGCSIAEYGCGLGYLAYELYKLGYDITAYDTDSEVLRKAEERTGLSIYEECDCYDISTSSDYAIAMFFGRITEEGNIERLMKPLKQGLIYITGGGSARHTAPSLVSGFLNDRKIPFSVRELELEFSQPLKDADDATAFLRTYYRNEELLKDKASNLKPYGRDGFEYILENRKELTIYTIRKE